MTLRWAASRDADDLLAVTLGNDLLRLTILPELGGKLWSIFWEPGQRELLWHHPTLRPQPAYPGAPYDDRFCGGWDELFPSDRAVEIGGVAYPDHGEWWSIPWEWDVAEMADALTLTLRGEGFATPHQAMRRIVLRDGDTAFALHTRIENRSQRDIPYLWRHHPALPVQPGARLDMPGAAVTADPEDMPWLDPQPFRWPWATLPSGVERDLRPLPDVDSGEVWMLYANELAEGWAEVTYPAEHLTMRFTFDPAQVRTVTTFATFAGWRDLTTILPEAGVGYPADLRAAVAAGTSGILPAGEMVEYEMGVEIITGA